MDSDEEIEPFIKPGYELFNGIEVVSSDYPFRLLHGFVNFQQELAQYIC